jgi:antitoxin MazE
MTVAIAKWGHSAALRLPKALLNQLSLKIGDQVELAVRDGQLVIEPSKPSLDQLLSGITPENQHKEMFVEPVGDELL